MEPIVDVFVRQHWSLGEVCVGVRIGARVHGCVMASGRGVDNLKVNKDVPAQSGDARVVCRRTGTPYVLLQRIAWWKWRRRWRALLTRHDMQLCVTFTDDKHSSNGNGLFAVVFCKRSTNGVDEGFLANAACLSRRKTSAYHARSHT